MPVNLAHLRNRTNKVLWKRNANRRTLFYGHGIAFKKSFITVDRKPNPLLGGIAIAKKMFFTLSSLCEYVA